MQKINFFILKHILGLDPYVLKQEKEKGSNSGMFFSIFTFSFLIIFFITLLKSVQAILYDLPYWAVIIISFVAFLPFYNVFSFALVSWRSHNSFLGQSDKTKFSDFISSTVTLLTRCVFLFLTLGLFIGLSYTLLNQESVSQDIKGFKNSLVSDYQNNLNEQVEIDKKIESREYNDVINEINNLEDKIANSNSRLDSLSYLSLKKPLLERRDILAKEIQVIEQELLADSDQKLKKYKAEINKNPFFLKSLILLSERPSFLTYMGLILAIFGVFMFMFWWRFVRSKSIYFKIDNHLHKNAILRTSTPIVKRTIQIVKSKFNYDYKTQFPLEKEPANEEVEPEVIMGRADFITKLRKNEL